MKNKQAFTLIELLVVVLIIGILAAGAVPQYQLAVLKTRAAQAFPALNAMETAQNIYYLQNGVFAVVKQDLDIQIPSDIVKGNGGDFSQFGMVIINDDLILLWGWNINQQNHQCMANSPLAKRVCQSLGGVPIDHFHNSATKQYYKLP